MSTAIVIVVSAILTAVITWGSWHFDQRIIQANSLRSSNFYATIIGISSWTVFLILLANLLQVPGYFGPVQYVHGSRAGMVIFNLRAITFLIMFLTPLIAGIVYSLSSESAPAHATAGWQRRLLAVTAMITYFVAWTLFFELEFFPTV